MIFNKMKSRKMFSFLLIMMFGVITVFFANDRMEDLKISLNLKFNLNSLQSTYLTSTSTSFTSSSSIKPISVNKKQDKLNEFYKLHEEIYAQQNASLKKLSINGYTLGGYGNKLYSFLTSLIIAILTKSQLVVKWNHIDKYISPPSNFKIFVNITDDAGLNENEFKNKSIYFETTQAWSLNKNINLLMKTFIPTNGYLRYFYSSINPFFMEICSNPLYFNTFIDYDLTSNETVRLALNAILNENKTNQFEKQEKIFRVGFEVGGNLLNRIWLPNQDLKSQIDYYINEYFKNNFVIGLQLRYGDGNPNQIYLNATTDTNKFINCALEIEQIYKNNNNKSKSFKWFIATDTPANLETYLKSYTNKTFSSNGTLSHVAYNSNGYAKTIIDVELLSRCDELVVTGGSTFGWISAMKMQKLPYFINGFSSMEKCLRSNLGDRLPKTPTNYAVFK